MSTPDKSRQTTIRSVKEEQLVIPGIDPPQTRAGWSHLSNTPEAARQRKHRMKRRALQGEKSRDSAVEDYSPRR